MYKLCIPLVKQDFQVNSQEARKHVTKLVCQKSAWGRAGAPETGPPSLVINNSRLTNCCLLTHAGNRTPLHVAHRWARQIIGPHELPIAWLMWFFFVFGNLYPKIFFLFVLKYSNSFVIRRKITQTILCCCQTHGVRYTKWHQRLGFPFPVKTAELLMATLWFIICW